MRRQMRPTPAQARRLCAGLCASLEPTPVDDGQGHGCIALFVASSPAQTSVQQLLRVLSAAEQVRACSSKIWMPLARVAVTHGAPTCGARYRSRNLLISRLCLQDFLRNPKPGRCLRLLLFSISALPRQRRNLHRVSIKPANLKDHAVTFHLRYDSSPSSSQLVVISHILTERHFVSCLAPTTSR